MPFTLDSSSLRSSLASVISSSISRVIISPSPRRGVILRLTPTSLYSIFAVVCCEAPTVCTTEPVNGILSPTKIEELLLS